MPRILFLMPTKTYRASAFLQAAEKLNYHAVVGTERRQALADFARDKNLTLDFNNLNKCKQEIYKLSQNYSLDAIIPVDEETAVVAAEAAEMLDLPGNSTASALAAREKHRLREILSQANLPSPGFKVISIGANVDKESKNITYPCVLKPLFLSSSRGVIRANSFDDFVEAFHRIKAILQENDIVKQGGSLAKSILVEDYIPGKEVALEGIFTEGVLKVLAIFDKPDPLEGPYFEETIYVTPSRHPETIQRYLADCVSKAAKAMGIHSGPVHAELRVNEDGPWIIEIAARSIGGLCSQTLRFSDGMSLEELILKHAVGEDISLIERESCAAGVMMIPIPKAGFLKAVEGLAEAKLVANIEEIKITIPITQKVLRLPEGNRYLGFIFARADRPEQVEHALREAHHKLDFIIET